MTSRCDNHWLDTGYVEGSGATDSTPPSVWVTTHYTDPEDTSRHYTALDTLRHGREITNRPGRSANDPDPCDHGYPAPSWMDSIWAPVPSSPNTVLLADTAGDSTYLIKIPVRAELQDKRLDGITISVSYNNPSSTWQHYETSEPWEGDVCCPSQSPGEAYVPALTIQRASWPDR
jgi:hypothetical protein